MSPLERLFRLEIAYARQDREAGDPPDRNGVRTSYALQGGEEVLLRADPPGTTLDDVIRMGNRFLLGADQRDVVRARDSLTRILYLDGYLTGRIDRNCSCAGDMVSSS
jgi:hypothetical protein